MRRYHSNSGLTKEVALYIIAKSIEMANSFKDTDYYCDWYKVHKLMFYAQGEMLKKYDELLFQTDIICDDSGPMIYGIDDIAIYFDFDPITTYKHPILERILNNDDLIFNKGQIKVMNDIVDRYGYLNRDEIINLARKNKLWQEYYDRRLDLYRNYTTEKDYPVIPIHRMKQYFKNKELIKSKK